MFCEKCGRQILDNKNVCSYCGFKMNDKNKSKNILLAVLLGVLVLALILVIFIIGFNKDDKSFDVEFTAYTEFVLETESEVEQTLEVCLLSEPEKAVSEENVLTYVIIKGAPTTIVLDEGTYRFDLSEGGKEVKKYKAYISKSSQNKYVYVNNDGVKALDTPMVVDNGAVEFDIIESERTLHTSSGTLVGEYKKTQPVLKSGYPKEVIDKINASLDKIVAESGLDDGKGGFTTINEFVNDDDATLLQKRSALTSMSVVTPGELCTCKIENHLANDKFVSFELISSVKNYGATGISSVKLGYVYDAKTGERLSSSDVFNLGNEFYTAVTNYIRSNFQTQPSFGDDSVEYATSEEGKWLFMEDMYIRIYNVGGGNPRLSSSDYDIPFSIVEPYLKDSYK